MSFRPSRVVERIDWAEGLFTLRVAPPLARFEPGQFVNVAISDGEDFVRRSYSLASAPGELVELYLIRVEGGALTPALEQLKVGDGLLVEDHARGFFTMEHVPDTPDGWLVSTGTGLAPSLSMLRSGALWRRFERVVLVHGVRRADHLGYRTELERAAADAPDKIRYLPMVSREDAPGALRGRVTEALADGRLETAAGMALDPARCHVMLCGNPAMIADMSAALGERGLRRHRVRKPGHVTIEKYW